MSKVRTFMILGLLVGSLAFATGCCGFDPCDPLPNPCDTGCDDPCASPCGTPAPAPAAAPTDGGKGCGGGGGCGGGKSCG